MSRIKAGLDLAVEIKEEEQLEEIQTEPTEETVEEFQEESVEETIAAIDENFEQTVEGIWSDFKRDFLGSEQRGGNAAEYFRHLAQTYAKESSKAKDAHNMETALKYRDLSWYYSLMSGNPPGHIKDADQFKYDTKKKYGQEIKADLDKAQMNELKEPDYGDDDMATYLKKLTPKKVKKDYEKTLPKGHKSLVKKYNLEEVSDDLVDRYRKKKNAQLSNIIGKAKGDMDAKVFDKDDVSTVKKRMRGTDLDMMRLQRQRGVPKEKRLSLKEGYEDRVQKIANYVASTYLSSPITKEQLERAIRNASFGTLDTSGSEQAKRDFYKDVYKALKGKVTWARKESSKPKIDYNLIGSIAVDAMGNVFPDGDPIDVIMPKLKRMGIDPYQTDIEPILDKAVRMKGYKGGYYKMLADFWDEMKDQQEYDKSHGHQPHFDLGDRNPWKPIKEEQDSEQPQVTNPKDKVTLDVPLLIRLLEYAREDAKTDMDLHDLTEKLVSMGSESGKTLSMKDYDQLVNNSEETNEAKSNHAMKMTKAMGRMLKPVKKPEEKKDEEADKK